MELHNILASFIEGNSGFEELENALRASLTEDSTLISVIQSEIFSPSNSQHFSEEQITELNSILNEFLEASEESDSKTQFSDKTRLTTPPAYTDNEKTQLQSSSIPYSTTGHDQPITNDADAGQTRFAPKQPSETPAGAPTTEPEDKLQVGSILKDRFVLESILGQGGMGVVFKARDLRKEEAHDRNPYVAIKVLNESFKDHPQSLIALQREARKAQTLAHPNIVTVFDFDRDADTVYMTMEYLEGDSLDRIIKQSHPNPVEKQQALHIIDGICSGLAYAHSHNIIHSDLKPGNIFVTKSNAVKIFDFGIARAMKHSDEGDNASGETTLFDAGSLGGLTPAYASYEMLVGGDPDIRDDIYALACIAYELLGGRHPFNKVPANQAKQKNLIPAAIHTIHRRQNKGLQRALSFDRDTRTESVLLFQRDVVKEKKLGKATIVAAGIAIIALIIISVFPARQYFKQRENDAIISALKETDNNVVNNALAKLDKLDKNSRDTVLNETKDTLIHYFEQRADTEIDSSKNKYNYKTALAILQEAKHYYPDSNKLAQTISRVEDSKNQLLNELTKKFNAHLENGDLLPRAGSEDILDILAKVTVIDDKHPLLSDPRLPVAYAEQAQRAAQAHNFRQADALLSAGLGLFPSDTALINIRDAVAEAESSTTGSDKELIAKLKKSLEKSLSVPEKQQRIAGLIDKPFSDRHWNSTLQSYMEDIKSSLGKDDPWLAKTTTGIADLYLKQAKSMRNKERFTEAANMIKLARQYAPSMPQIGDEEKMIALAKKQYTKTLAEKAQTAKIEGLKQTLLTQARANDVKAAKANYENLKKMLPSNNRFIKVDAPTAIAEAYLRLAKGLGARGNFKSAVQLLNAGLEIAPSMAKLKDAINEYNKVLQKSTTSSTSTSTRTTASVKMSSDPCKASFAGYGKRSKATCYDSINGNAKGPAMVVVPAGNEFKQPFAIGKYEISIADYNTYCQLSGECKPNSSKNSSLPITNISVNQAIKYAAWLTKTTGYTYRLPKDKEWVYAASAKGQQPTKDFNCRVMLGDTLVKGNALLSIKSGKTNGWGLANYVGNAQEWVYSSPSSFSVRGGSYQDSLSNCDISIQRTNSGKPDNYTGFRLVRELKLNS